MSMIEYRLPDVGEGMHEGEIVKWHVQEGERIEEDQVILEIQNDKSVVELPAPAAGVMKQIKVAEGTIATVGDVLAVIEIASDGVAGQTASASDAKEDHEVVGGTGQIIDDKAPAPAGSELHKPTDQATAGTNKPAEQAVFSETVTAAQVLATPGVRKYAREQGINLALVQPTGRNGQVTREDIMAYMSGDNAATISGTAPAEAVAPQAAQSQATGAQAAVVAPPKPFVPSGDREEERIPFRGIRKVIAEAMVKSVYTAPHVTVMDEVDVQKLVQFRERYKPLAEQKGVKLTYLPFIVKALIGAAREFPMINATLDEEKGEIVYKKYYDIGIATDTEQGLIVPVIRNADRKSIWTIAAEIRGLAERGRSGKLSMDEMRGSTITITNIGSAGGMFFTPVINYPEVAILGTGRITEKPVVKDGEIAIGQLMALSLSFDHRIIDGASAQLAMNYVKRLLEEPELLIMEV